MSGKRKQKDADTPTGDGTPTEKAGKDKDALSVAESAGKVKDSTPTSQVGGKDKDASSSPAEEPGKYPIGSASKKKKQASSPRDTPEDAPLSSPAGSGGTVLTESSGRTYLSEDGEQKSKGKDKSPNLGSPQEELKPLRKRVSPRLGMAGPRGPGKNKFPKSRKDQNARLKKVVKKGQMKHQRSFCPYIMKILKDVDNKKKISSQAMMIHDSFANDLSDKIIAAATQLVATSRKKQLGSAQIIAAVKLVLPPDMARDATRCIEASVKSYKDLTHKWQEQIQDVNKLKEKVNKGESTPK